jgi:uncharacterized protein
MAAMLVAAPGVGVAQPAPDGVRLTAPTAQAVAPERFGEMPGDAAYGAFQRGFYLTALELALERAEDGDKAAQTLAAEIYSRGLGVRRDLAKAARWYEAAAEQGVTEARFQLAMMLYNGNGVDRDRDRAYALMEQAADAGHLLARFNYAQMVMEREPGLWGSEKAVSYFELAAEAGLAAAQYAMSQVYREGFGGKPADDAVAREWPMRAARQNFDTAQLDLATWLVQGRGGERDYDAGFAWMRRAAELGNVAAQNRLAKLYRAGIGVEGDSIEAASWYLIARQAGLVDPEMEDHLDGLDEDEIAEARERARALR